MSVQREDGVTSGSSDDTGIRLGRVESELRQLRTDVDVIKATGATKDDLAWFSWRSSYPQWSELLKNMYEPIKLQEGGSKRHYKLQG